MADGEKVLAVTLPFAFDAYLVAALREQQQEIEALRAELAELSRLVLEARGAAGSRQ